MRELTQTSLHPAGNCWQYCVACLLDLDPEVMPPQSEYDKRWTREDGHTEYGPSYQGVLGAYLLKHHHLAYVEIHVPDEARPFIAVAPGTLHMLTGRTVRSEAQDGARHVVVARDASMIWDPHPSRAGLTDQVRLAFLVPFPKEWDSDYWRKVACVCAACKQETPQ